MKFICNDFASFYTVILCESTLTCPIGLIANVDTDDVLLLLLLHSFMADGSLYCNDYAFR